MKIAHALKEISRIADKYEKNTPYLVGGAVRDFLSGKTPNDIDITTGDFDCLELADLFAKEKNLPLRIYKSGAKQTRYNGLDLDFSPHTLYIETDSPLVSEVLSRDYTINAMMIDASNGDFLDFCGGLQDLKNDTLRCAFSSEITFKNPANAIRGVRLIANGYKPTKSTEDGIVQNLEKWKELPEKQAKKIINNALRANPEIVLWLKDRGLLAKIPATQLLINILNQFRMLKYV